ncbi:MAG TPA: hypothetical protein VJ438_06005 [Candidatus Nanoarchaeia archaeon]|nr:hypothetical protein [Candidatus Nanoarchaeia archaeon]
MKNKKGMLGILIGLLISIMIIISLIITTINNPSNIDLCKTKFKEYNLKECNSNFEAINICYNINSTWIKTEIHVFSNNVIYCYKDGEILRI